MADVQKDTTSVADGAGAVPDAPRTLDEAGQTIWKSLLSLWEDFLAHLPFLLAGLAVLLLTWLISKIVKLLVRSLLERSRFNSSFKDLLRQLTSIAVWLVGILVAAVLVTNLTPARVIAVLGLGSIAIGFAFKDIVENFLAGVLILWRFPFDPGDFIQCGEVEGKVEEVTIRMTKVRQTDGQLVVLPNAKLFKEPVNVLTSQPQRRTTVICGVAYDEDVDQSRGVIRDAVSKCETVSGDRPVEIFAQEFASSSINFEVTWWCGSTPLEVRQSRDEVVAAVKRALDKANIEIPFPYRTLTFKEALRTAPLESALSESAED